MSINMFKQPGYKAIYDTAPWSARITGQLFDDGAYRHENSYINVPTFTMVEYRLHQQKDGLSQLLQAN